jgi:protein-S-isoprenylcysteine O-methyltransferase Ste14
MLRPTELAMNWSDAYFELACGTLFAAVGLTFLVLIRLKAARSKTAVAPTVAAPTRPPTFQLDVRFFFYFSAFLYGLAVGRAAPFPWSLLGVLAAVVALVPLARAVRSIRATAKAKKTV